MTLPVRWRSVRSGAASGFCLVRIVAVRGYTCASPPVKVTGATSRPITRCFSHTAQPPGRTTKARNDDGSLVDLGPSGSSQRSAQAHREEAGAALDAFHLDRRGGDPVAVAAGG